MTAQIDDQTVAYVTAIHPCFEDLKQVAAQLAGFLVLSAAGSASASPDHPLLKSARALLHQAVDGIKAVGAGPQVREHHSHMTKASALLEDVLHSLVRRDDPLAALEQAWTELRSASRALPGFPILDFERGCCVSAQAAVRCAR